jgi:hypothetical protein
MTMPRGVHGRTFLGIAAGVAAVAAEGCGGQDLTGPTRDGGGDGTIALGDDGSSIGSDGGVGGSDGSGGDGSSSGGDGSSSGFSLPPGCTGDAGQPLNCYIVPPCPRGASTTLKGTVFDPAGKNPVANAVVYVPNSTSALPAIATGTSVCTSCATPVGDYAALAITASDGSFTLTDVPSVASLPLVVQSGKWRRRITVSEVAGCATTTLPDSGPTQLRLPRSRAEGDMPQMAILTGGADDLGCFLARVGVDPSEYTAPHAGGRVDVYQGLAAAGSFTGPDGGVSLYGPGLSGGVAGDCTTTSCPLWSSTRSLDAYDVVFLGCEGAPYDQAPDGGDAGDAGNAGIANVTPAAKQAMHDWLGQGGKLFAAHDQSAWFQNGPLDFQRAATWRTPSSGAAACSGCTVDDSFQGGQFLQQWLQTIGLVPDGGTQLALSSVTDSVSTVNLSSTIRWVYDPDGGDTKLLSFATPVGGLDAGMTDAARQYCGKAVFFDLHAGGPPEGDVPGSCSAADLTPDEKLLEYQLFDESTCVQDTMVPPLPGQGM